MTPAADSWHPERNEGPRRFIQCKVNEKRRDSSLGSE